MTDVRHPSFPFRLPLILSSFSFQFCLSFLSNSPSFFSFSILSSFLLISPHISFLSIALPLFTFFSSSIFSFFLSIAPISLTLFFRHLSSLFFLSLSFIPSLSLSLLSLLLSLSRFSTSLSPPHFTPSLSLSFSLSLSLSVSFAFSKSLFPSLFSPFSPLLFYLHLSLRLYSFLHISLPRKVSPFLLFSLPISKFSFHLSSPLICLSLPLFLSLTPPLTEPQHFVRIHFFRSYSTDTDRNPMGLGCHIAFVADGLTRDIYNGDDEPLLGTGINAMPIWWEAGIEDTH
ncbi:unnamed protein product [Acanthosepion pharaonis]|uniref:Uncharacterized protein n=1 Tax=Acanthosepion pharaonis TaxID=158019 RepID=A0A812DZT3_ACAPH|nr:unnamed protein product [Sepia pharaonis]